MTNAVSIAQSGSNNVTMRNRIINGNMMIDQRNAGASSTAISVYTVDRWNYGASQGAKGTWQQKDGQNSSASNYEAGSTPAGFKNSLKFTSSSAYSVLASDYFEFYQPIEGSNVTDFNWGTASASPVTLSFWVKCSLTGTFAASIQNSGTSRSYPCTYTISSANTWEYKTITIPGDTSGTWLTTTGVGIYLVINIGSGSNYATGTPNAWTNGNINFVTGATSVVGTNGATFYITGVQLEKGSTATPFEQRLYGTELQLAQRYYQLINGFQGLAVNSNSAIAGVICPVQMRATPSATATSALIITDTANSYTQSSPSASGITGNGFGGRTTLSNFTGLTSLRPFVDNGAGGSIALSSEL